MPRPRHKNKAIIRLSSHPSRQSLCFDSKLVAVVVVIGLMETRLYGQLPKCHQTSLPQGHKVTKFGKMDAPRHPRLSIHRNDALLLHTMAIERMNTVLWYS